MTWVVIGVVSWLVVVGWVLLFLKGGTDWDDCDLGRTAEASSVAAERTHTAHGRLVNGARRGRQRDHVGATVR